jgi:hypothetical protein
MNGRITRLIDDEQIGSITAEDGTDYPFSGRSMLGADFSTLCVGLWVTFTPSAGPGTRTATSVRVPTK